MPAFIPPMNATLVAAPFENPEWLFEVKWDGFRVETIVDEGGVRTLTRGGLDAARYFGSFLEPPTWIAARQAIVDGEVIAVDEAGEPDFARLQAGIKGRVADAAGSAPFLYMVFDLLFVDGRSLLAEPLEERRRLLAEALRPDPRVRFSEHIERDGVAAFAAAKERGLEGIMAKDRRSPYQPGLTHADLAEDQDPPRAGARRGWLDDRHRSGDRPGGPAGGRLRGRPAQVRREDRYRLHRQTSGPSSWGSSPPSPPTTNRL